LFRFLAIKIRQSIFHMLQLYFVHQVFMQSHSKVSYIIKDL